MKIAQNIMALSLIPIVSWAVQTGCHKDVDFINFRAKAHRGRNDLSASPSASNPCEVDFPVALLRMSKKHTIAWAAEDHDYWIYFPKGNPVRNKSNQGS